MIYAAVCCIYWNFVNNMMMLPQFHPFQNWLILFWYGTNIYYLSKEINIIPVKTLGLFIYLQKLCSFQKWHELLKSFNISLQSKWKCFNSKNIYQMLLQTNNPSDKWLDRDEENLLLLPTWCTFWGEWYLIAKNV